MNHTSVLIYRQRRPRHESRLWSIMQSHLVFLSGWTSVCMFAYKTFSARFPVSRVFFFFCFFLPVCVLSRLTRRNGYSPVLSCCIQRVGLYTRDSQCEPDLGTATKPGHRTEKMDDSVRPENMKFFPLYMCTSVCVWERIILVELPPSEVNVRAR